MLAIYRPRIDGQDPLAEKWAVALRMIGEGSSRRAAAKAVGMNAMTLWNRLERYRLAHGLPPLPDARCGPRRRESA